MCGVADLGGAASLVGVGVVAVTEPSAEVVFVVSMPASDEPQPASVTAVSAATQVT